MVKFLSWIFQWNFQLYFFVFAVLKNFVIVQEGTSDLPVDEDDGLNSEWQYIHNLWVLVSSIE